MREEKKKDELRVPPLPPVPPFSLRGGIKDLYSYKHTRFEGEYARHLWKIQLALIFICVLLVYFFYTNRPASPPTPPASSSLLTLKTDKASYLPGETALLSGASQSCGDVIEFYLNTVAFANITLVSINATYSYNLTLPETEGEYLVRAESAQCAESVQISVRNQVCAPGELRACVRSDGCTGTQVCGSWGWGSCSIKRICVPGERVTCAYDTCNSGYWICNECGTEYGNCINPNIKKEQT